MAVDREKLAADIAKWQEHYGDAGGATLADSILIQLLLAILEKLDDAIPPTL